MLQTNISPFGTLITAMVTPFTNEGHLDVDSAQNLARYLVENGSNGIVVTGTTGEISTLRDEEHTELYQAVIEAVGDRATIIAGTCTNDTHHSIGLTQRSQECGVDAILAVTPYYNKPPQSGLIEHFRAVASSVDLPIMLYDIPGRTGIPLQTETILTLAEIPNIRALKDAKGDLLATTRVLAESDLLVYSGDDGLTLPLMSVGAVGCVSVSSHIAPRAYRTMIDHALQGDFVQARQLHYKLDPVQRAVMSHLQGAVAAKQFLYRAGIIASPRVRLPLVEPNETEFAPLMRDYQLADPEIFSLPKRLQ